MTNTSNAALLEQRRCGLLLHPTSLPSSYGIGDFGPAAFSWLDWLASTGSTLWQVLPLGPTGYGDSPYQSFSSFAGNALLISPELLIEDGLLHQGEIELLDWPPSAVDFGRLIPYKQRLLGLAADRHRRLPPPAGATPGLRRHRGRVRRSWDDRGHLAAGPRVGHLELARPRRAWDRHGRRPHEEP